MPDTIITLQQAAKDALGCQDACNLSGVAHSFLQAVQAINVAAHQTGEGTEWRNNHPIIRLYVDKLGNLCGMQGTGYERYAEAAEECRRLAGEEGV